MTTEKPFSKIDIKVGSIAFAAEGEPSWLSQQLEKVLAAASTAGAIKAESKSEDAAEIGTQLSAKFSASLASHLKQMAADKKQIRRFLATADWLRRRGNEQTSSSEVAKALLDNQQSRLANPADCLNKNVGQGYCEKIGKTFFITPEGLRSLGYK